MTFKLSKKSLHFRIASVYGGHEKYNDETDLCSYLKNVAKGLIVLSLLIIILGGVIGVMIGELVAWVSFLCFNSFIDPTPPAVVGMVIVAMLLLLIIMAIIYDSGAEKKIGRAIRNTARAIRNTARFVLPKKDSFIALAYRTFKEKTCVRISLD